LQGQEEVVEKDAHQVLRGLANNVNNFMVDDFGRENKKEQKLCICNSASIQKLCLSSGCVDCIEKYL